ncbi:hypothetical protein B7494_g4298 [Chlorociboria aeruginascens]|nr:hypothetical protein B7494_g4298 [Chlorociboria aeruginascens]
MSASPSVSPSSSPEPTDSSNSPNSPKRKPGRPQLAPLDDYKDQIISLYCTENLALIDIARRLTLERGLIISERTISRRLKGWDVPKKKQRVQATPELHSRIEFHFNKNLKDPEIAEALQDEGFDINVKSLARMRKRLGMRRRAKFPEFREEEEEEEEEEVAAQLGVAMVKRRKVEKKVVNAGLIPKVTMFVEGYMKKYDGSHDFNHIKRVLGLAHKIYNEVNVARERERLFDEVPLDLQIITLAALLHDVGDKKYLEPGQEGNTLVLSTLLGFGAGEELAVKVQRIVLGVSYSSEMKDQDQVKALIGRYPELAVVQDADRLDAIGAVGIGRTFTFGGAKGARDMGETLAHFDEKLVRLEGLMKTGPGKRMARERTERLKIFQGWWEEEQREAEGVFRRK